ncbi:MAG: hypothetical protein ACYCZC_01245 [Acidithiobacillus sp.]
MSNGEYRSRCYPAAAASGWAGPSLDCRPTGTPRIGVIVVGGLIFSQYLILYITVAFYLWMEALREWCTL